MFGYWDIHNHILPGIDDGAGCLEETIDMLYEEYEQGIRNVIFTPHYRNGMFMIDADKRKEVYEAVKSYYDLYLADKLPEMQFFLGCELHMHPDQSEHIVNELYRMPGDRVLLTEFSGKDGVKSIRDVLKPLVESGYHCVVAHVERYDLSVEDIKELKSMDGIYIQCNADAILGKDGLSQMFFTRKLLKNKLVDLVGSDGHNTQNRPIHMKECITFLKKKYGIGYTNRMLRDNPEQIFG